MKIPIKYRYMCAPEPTHSKEDDVLIDDEPIILTHDIVEELVVSVLMERPMTVREIKRTIYEYTRCNVSEQRIRKIIMEHKTRPPFIEWDGTIRRFRIIPVNTTNDKKA